jgi:hypothetical protein
MALTLASRGEELATVVPPHETPVFPFTRYAIAFHLAAEWVGDEKPDARGGNADERGLESYEADMLAHAHRDAPPFVSCVVPTPEKPRRLTVHFPSVTTYEAEGAPKRLECDGASAVGRTRRFALTAFRTTFERSDIAVLSLVLGPQGEPPAADSELNEYDVIKLIKLWEGGEIITVREGEPEPFVPGLNDLATKISFETETQSRASLKEVAREIFGNWHPLPLPDDDDERRAYRVGTVELELPDARWRKTLFRDLMELKDTGSAPKRGTLRWHRAVAVGGILQGLLDFREIQEEELADVFAEVDIDADEPSLLAVHKGTLVSLAGESGSAEERPPPAGIDPYLAVPNAVLLHNEERLKSARVRDHVLSDAQRERLLRRGRPLKTAGMTITETENRLGEMSRHLSHHLPNVFHYTSERELYERGMKSRGFDDLETLLRRRMDEHTILLQERIRRRDLWVAALGIIIAVGATAQAFIVQEAIKGVSVWIVAVGALVLYGGLLFLRNTRFF